MLTRSPPGTTPGCSRKQTTDEPAPSLPSHYRSFSTTTSRSASVSASVLNASQFLLLDALPLATPTFPGHRSPYRHTPSHVPCSSRRPGSRRLHTGHHLASKRAPARLFPKFYIYPGFDVVSCFSMLHQRFAFARLPDPRLTAFTPPFPQSLTTTVFSLCSMRRLDVSPRRATPKGHKTFIYYTALLHRGLPTLDLSFAFVAHMEEQISQHRRHR